MQGGIAPDSSREGPQWFLTSPGLTPTTSTALRVPSATAVVRRRMLSSQSYEVPWLFVGVGAGDPWGAFGNIILDSWVCSRLSPSSRQPRTSGRFGTDSVSTSTKPQAEPTPRQVWNASILDFLTQINLEREESHPRA